MDPTQRTTLGSSDVSVTRFGVGLAGIGSLYRPVSEAEGVAVVDRAWERGIRLFDTAPLYGFGDSERRAGLALGRRPRAEFVLSTKVGRLLVPGASRPGDMWADPPPGVTARFDFSAAGVRRSVEESLRRLGLDRVDLLHIHDPDEHYGPALAQAYPALAELRKAGVVGAVGVGMNQAAMLTRFVRELGDGLDCVMLAGRYTLLDQSGLAELLPLCAERGVSVLAAAVYNSGLLADPTGNGRFNYAPAGPAVLGRALAMQEVCQRYDVPLRAAAVQFPFGHPAVAAVVCGAQSPAEVDDNVDVFAHPVPGQLWRDLKAAGLLPAATPTP
ncbi:MAG TPA: aldo/keto reductase [Catenuloplanes sp.]